MGLGLSGLRLGLGQRAGSGEPPIITATVDPVLTALTDAQTPADGFTSGTYASTAGTISSEVAAYLVNGSPELGTYDLAAGDTVRVSETVTDSAANERVFYTTTILVTPSVALSNTAVPVISGTFEVGQTVSSTEGTWAGSAARTYDYQWLREGEAIVGATSSTYTLVEADEGANVSCEVTADDGFTQVSAESTAEAVTWPAPVAAGALADQSYTEGATITPFDTSADFTGSGITYALSPSSAALPTGLSLSSAGVISGTPTATVTGAAIIIRGTNSGGFDDSAFSLTVSAAATVPAQFGTGDWSVASGDAQASVTITTLPDDGGATITDVEYQLDGGSWVSSGGTTSFTISSLTNDTTYSVALRAVNSVGNGTASATKDVTPAAGGAFHPSDLFASSEVGVVYDYSDTSTLWQDTGKTTAASSVSDPIGCVEDLSGNGNDAIQATASKRPIVYDAGSGAYMAAFDGIDDAMASTSAVGLSGTTQVTICAAIYKGANTSQIPLEHGTGSVGFYAIHRSNGADFKVDGNTQAAVVTTINGGPNAGDYYILTMKIDRAETGPGGDEFKVRLDGSDVPGASYSGSDLTGNFINETFYIAARTASSLYANCRIAAIVVIDRLLTAQELSDLETWMSDRTPGITL